MSGRPLHGIRILDAEDIASVPPTATLPVDLGADMTNAACPKCGPPPGIKNQLIAMNHPSRYGLS